jgi:hypothetical protein
MWAAVLAIAPGSHTPGSPVATSVVATSRIDN